MKHTSVKNLIESIKNDQLRKDSKTLLKVMEDFAGVKPTLDSRGRVSFDDRIGFLPRKHDIALFVLVFTKEQEELLQKLGTYVIEKIDSQSVLCIRNLEDIDKKVLKRIFKLGYEGKELDIADLLGGLLSV